MPDLSKKDFRWWLEGAPDGALKDTFEHIWNNDRGRRIDDRLHSALYTNRGLGGVGPRTYERLLTEDRVTLNVVKSVCDTIVSRIARSRPRPTFLTSGGNHSTRRRAKLLERFVDGQFYLSRVFEKAPRVFLDACVFGTGVAKVFRDPGSTEIKFERILPSELFVDYAEGFYEEPQQIIQSKFVNRDVLLELFPEHQGAILAASNPSDQWREGTAEQRSAHDSTADQLRVVEGWHLPSGPGAGDGRHQITIESKILADEPWEKDYLPFVFVRWSSNLRGFFGIGVAEELRGLQSEINKLLITIKKIMDLVSIPRIFVESGSKIKKSQINNQIGAIVPYAGTPPIISSGQSVPGELFAHLDRLYQRAFEIAGVSQLSASSQKPAGLESGAALRAFSDIESGRFAVVSQAYEQMFLDIAVRMVDLGREIHEEDPSYSVVAQRDKRTIQEVKWADVDLDRDAYVLKVFPSSSLPQSPSGRLAMIEQLIGLRLIDIEEGKRLLDYPDLDRSVALDRAASDYIDRVAEQMIDDGVYEAPEPFIDHQLALKKIQAEYNKAVNDSVEEDRLRLLRQFMVAVNEFIKRAQMEQQAQLNQAQSMQAGVAPPAPGPNGVAPNAVSAGDGQTNLQ